MSAGFGGEFTDAVSESGPKESTYSKSKQSTLKGKRNLIPGDILFQRLRRSLLASKPPSFSSTAFEEVQYPLAPS